MCLITSDSGSALKSPVTITGNPSLNSFTLSNIRLTPSRRATTPIWSRCVFNAKYSFPEILSFNLPHEAMRSQAPSHPLEPAISGVSLNQKYPEASNSKRAFLYQRALYSPFTFPSSRPTPITPYSGKRCFRSSN